MEAATARTAPAARPAPRSKPRRKAAPAKRRTRPARSSARSGQAPAGRLIRPAMAGAALFPQAAMRSAGAVRDFSDSSLIHRLTRGRSWIAVLCALLGGIVALNVLSLSLTAGSGRTSLQIDELKTDVSSLQAQIEEKLSAVKVEAEAARLGLANPDPKVDHLPERFRRRCPARRASARHRRLPARPEPAVELSGARHHVRAGPDDERGRDDRRTDDRHRRAHHDRGPRKHSGHQRGDRGRVHGNGDPFQRRLERVVDRDDRRSGALGP